MVSLWRIDLTLVEEWLVALDEESYTAVIAGLELLAEHGPALGRPLVDTVHGSRHRNMKELRPGSKGRSEVRMLFAFDPGRAAIFLVAGDKRDRWHSWYQRAIPMADDRFDAHLDAMREDA